MALFGIGYVLLRPLGNVAGVENEVAYSSEHLYVLLETTDDKANNIKHLVELVLKRTNNLNDHKKKQETDPQNTIIANDQRGCSGQMRIMASAII